MEQKFTTMAQEAISDAVQNASAAGNAQVETLHLLDALLRQENGVIRGLIEAAGGNAQKHQRRRAPSAGRAAKRQRIDHRATASQQATIRSTCASRQGNAADGRRIRIHRTSAHRHRGGKAEIRARKSWNNTA